MRKMSARAAAIGPLLALASCAAAAPGARTERRALPVSEAGPELAVRVAMRYLTSQSVSVVVHLVARYRLPVVRIDASSPDHELTIAGGCTFEPLWPPQSATTRRPPRPLPVVPLCSLVVEAAVSGRYPVDVRILDAAGRDLVEPIHTAIRIGSKP